MEIRWFASMSGSCLHAVRGLIEGPRLVDAELEAALADPTRAFVEEFAPQLSETPLLRHLAALAGGIENNRELATVALTKASGRENAELLAPSLARHLAGLELAFSRARPNVIVELEHRSRPIREQWEARGPGLLSQIARATEPDLLVERADVMLVHPAAGGCSRAYPTYNLVVMEGVLANSHSDLPEAVRLGWALSQLNLDLPKFSETLPPIRRDAIGGLAMVPVTLAAAEFVELAKCDEATIHRALDAWNFALSTSADIAASLMTWWQTYVENRPAWLVALAALDRMLRI
jgi:hypothetical protein